MNADDVIHPHCLGITCTLTSYAVLSKGVVTRNSSGDEIANVTFLYDDIVHAL